jgi:hypothetical protein
VTIAGWLRARTPAPPPRLTARIDSALGARRDAPVAELPQHCIATAEELLRDLLSRDSAGRESALDLLAVDALVTYAFEAAATDPVSLEGRADSAARALANAAAG